MEEEVFCEICEMLTLHNVLDDNSYECMQCQNIVESIEDEGEYEPERIELQLPIDAYGEEEDDTE